MQHTLPKLFAYDYYVTAIFTLLREGEQTAMLPGWINFEQHTITIPPADSKSGHEETIALHPRAEEAIVERLRLDGRLLEVVDGQSFEPLRPEDPIFPPHDLRKAWKCILVKANIPIVKDGKRLTPLHFSRHTGATLVGPATKDSLALKAIGRWRSLRMVERYTHGQMDRAREALLKIGMHSQ